MNTDFRILRENTFNLKGGKLYLMLLRENGNYGVEVVDREKTFGRKMSKDRKEADFLFDTIEDRLARYKNLKEAEKAIESCFGFKSLDKLLFVLIMDDRISCQADIVAMKGKVKFVTRPEFGDNDSLTVYIFENKTDKKPYGVLKGTTKVNDFKFELL
jgi:hypothetical protein